MSEEKENKTRAILERVEKERGFVRLWPKLLSERDPEFMECLHNVATHALHKRDHLPRKIKEIIVLCLDAFDYYEYGFRIHVRNALAAGATEDELLEALEVVGVLKLHCMTSMLPALVEEIETFQKEKASAPERK